MPVSAVPTSYRQVPDRAGPPGPDHQPAAGRDLPRRPHRARLHHAAGAAGRHHPVRPEHRQAGQHRHPASSSPAFPDAAAYAAADRTELEQLITPTGFFRAKTDSLIKLGAALVERFDGEVPATMEGLDSLPGVGRKTANVVLGNAFGVPGITVDTHFGRLVRRFGWTDADRPGQGRARGRRAVPAARTGPSSATTSSGTAAGAATSATRPAAPARSPAGARRTARARPTRSRRPSWSVSRADEALGRRRSLALAARACWPGAAARRRRRPDACRSRARR